MMMLMFLFRIHMNSSNSPFCKTPEDAGTLINMFLISRHIERIADHATNIAEEVIYVTDGEIVRHGKF